MTTAFIYTRISSDRSGDELGIQRQEAICRDYADRHGLMVVEVFADNDISAFSGKPRPAYEEMLARLRAREVSTVLVYKVDRLYRRVADLSTYVDACGGERGISTIAVKGGGVIDLSTSAGRLNAGVMAQFSEFESDVKAERLRDKFAQLARSGGYHGGPVPFGWKVEFDEHGKVSRVVDQEKAQAVEQAARDVLAGVSVGVVMRRWNDQGWTGSRSAPFTQTSVRNVLKRPANAGFAVHQGHALEGVPGPWPAIMSVDLWRGVRAVLSDPSRRRAPTNKPKHPLSGIAQCWCGALLYASSVGSRGKVVPVYRCKVQGPGHVAIIRDGLDLLVRRVAAALYAFVERQADRMRVSEEVVTERANLESELAALAARLDEVVRMYANGGLSEGVLSKTSTALEVQMNEKRDRLNELSTAVPVLPSSPEVEAVDESSAMFERFAGLPIDEQRDFLRQYMNVVCWPGWGNARTDLGDRVVVVLKSNTIGPGPLSREDIDGAGAANGLPVWT
ncbi:MULTISPECIES: recombinase family protein [Citricoccus]|uniref:recombinase family protein n=1 Tax=Citricoccus TaxID=169133 RepID=UPI000255E08B|nr:recombinase family protein [Citricoccus sp. CH26A]